MIKPLNTLSQNAKKKIFHLQTQVFLSIYAFVIDNQQSDNIKAYVRLTSQYSRTPGTLNA